jgi:hypothetical protein
MAKHLLSTAVISNCTMRKAVGETISLRDIRLESNVIAVAQQWNELISRTPPTCTARHLYKGRSTRDAAAVAATVNGELLIVSAGLGLVSAEDPVPNYDVTTAPGSELAKFLAKQGLQASDWWEAIEGQNQRSLASVIASHVTYLALPSTYLQLISNQLDSAPKSALIHLRIFTSEMGQSMVPERLRACIIPYDERLESVPGFSGTRADFPQRALRHFVECLEGHKLSIEEGQQKVRNSLSPLPRRAQPQRARASDSEITALLRNQWMAYGGSSARLLRYLRDEAKVSCEQGRFRNLWRSIATEMAK